jgi:hypothetical protein
MTIATGNVNLPIAFCLGDVVGFERQWCNLLAGLRTNTLVALGAASFVVFAALVRRAKACGLWNRLSWCWIDLPRGYEGAPAQYRCHALVPRGISVLARAAYLAYATLRVFLSCSKTEVGAAVTVE